MKFIILFCSLILVGCGKNRVDLAPGTEEYVSQFSNFSAQQGKPVAIDNLIVQMSESDLPSTDGFTVGACYHESTPRVVIRASFWRNATDTHRQLVLMHELGHCLLGREHTSSKSIMQPAVPSDAVYENDTEFYIHELFNPT